MSQVDLILEKFEDGYDRTQHLFGCKFVRPFKISEMGARGDALLICYPTLAKVGDEEAKRRLMAKSNSGLYLRNQVYFQCESGAVVSFIKGQLHLVILNVENMEVAEFIHKLARFHGEVKEILDLLEAEVEETKICMGLEHFDRSKGFSKQIV